MWLKYLPLFYQRNVNKPEVPTYEMQNVSFCVLSNLALKLLLLLSVSFFFFVGVRFLSHSDAVFHHGLLSPKSSGVKLQESIVDDCPSILNRNQVTATSSCDMESSYTFTCIPVLLVHFWEIIPHLFAL